MSWFCISCHTDDNKDDNCELCKHPRFDLEINPTRFDFVLKKRPDDYSAKFTIKNTGSDKEGIKGNIKIDKEWLKIASSSITLPSYNKKKTFEFKIDETLPHGFKDTGIIDIQHNGMCVGTVTVKIAVDLLPILIIEIPSEYA